MLAGGVVENMWSGSDFGRQMPSFIKPGPTHHPAITQIITTIHTSNTAPLSVMEGEKFLCKQSSMFRRKRHNGAGRGPFGL